MKGLDLSETTIGKAHLIADGGYKFVIRYCSPNTPNHPTKCITLAEAHELRSHGLAIGLVYERLDTIDEFAPGKGTSHAREGLHVAHTIGWTSPSIFMGADNDFSDSQARGAISAYCEAAQDIIKPAGGLVRAYGSGLVLKILSTAGLIHGMGWLDQSSGHSGHAEWFPKADIVQGISTTFHGLGVDLNSVRSGLSLVDAGLWLPG
jgi:hypothetical protein